MSKICSIEGCDRLAVSRGWCDKHYRRWLKHNDPLYESPKPDPICKANGCDEPARCRGLCLRHYARWKNHGDYNVNLKDGLASRYPKEYHSWYAMKQRCSNPNNPEYHNYGERGIKICDKWSSRYSFRNFFNDMGKCPEGCTLDRIDVNGDYCLENCRWVDWNTQASNKRKRSTRTSKYLGVSKLYNKWKAELIIEGKRYYSIHESEEEAYKA